jgi:uncharacterized repeat protein (TIGR02543 family)
MGLWAKNPDGELERRLRAERPQPPERLLRMLGGEPAPAETRTVEPPVETRRRKPRHAPVTRPRVPRLVVLAAATAIVVGSLGTTGALATAGDSFGSFCKNVYHVISYHHKDGDGGDKYKDKDPFRYQYDHKVPICLDGHVTYVSYYQYFYLLKHEDGEPAYKCSKKLDVKVLGKGTVTSSPGFISCGPDCGYAYDTGTSVTLTESPASGWTFHGWGGDCSGSSPTCTLTMSSNRFVSATFYKSP